MPPGPHVLYVPGTRTRHGVRAPATGYVPLAVPPQVAALHKRCSDVSALRQSVLDASGRHGGSNPQP